jgi:hypothetical protein
VPPAKIEIAMDGRRPVRVLVADPDGEQHQLVGVADVRIEMQVNDVPRVIVEFLTDDIEVRKAYPEELSGPPAP